MFSSRLPPRLTENRVSRALRAARASGRPLIDLTVSNPTVVDIAYPAELASACADPAALRYDPQPFGLASARQAVAATYGTANPVPPDRVVLTASTSEAYSFLFKLLCDAGDEVLVPHPSYPLFELLTQLDGVRDVPYRLERDAHWRIDRESVLRARSARTRAILVVSPNNPTGSRLDADDREWLVQFAADHRLALISDEVFADYLLEPRPGGVSLAGEARVLTFTLGGLSKSVGLPQMKLAWTIVSGPDALVTEALERLALVADSYLSVATPVQCGVPRLLEHGAVVRSAIQARLQENLAHLHAAVRGAPAITVYPPEGGWSVVVRIPAILSGEEIVLRLLEARGVIVHPGYFFDLDGDGFLVISLLPPPAHFARGVAELFELVAEVGC